MCHVVALLLQELSSLFFFRTRLALILVVDDLLSHLNKFDHRVEFFGLLSLFLLFRRFLLPGILQEF